MNDDPGGAQALSDAEKAYLEAKDARFEARRKWDAAKGRYHLTLIAEREAGRKLTIADMKALGKVAIDEVPYVREAYLAFVAAKNDENIKQGRFNDANRYYWDKKKDQENRLRGRLS